jgi:putative transposase
MHMIRKGQFAIDGTHMSAADQFYALAGLVRPV